MLPRCGDDLLPVGHLWRLDGRNGDCREGGRANPIYHECEVYLPAVEGHDILLREFRHKYRLQHLGVEGPDPEDDRRSDVAKDGVAYLLLHLFDVLMRDDEIQFIFARFGEYLREGLVREVLELVNVEIKVWKLRKLLGRKIRAAHRGKEEARREHRAQETHIGLSDEALGKVDDDDFLLVHHLPDIEGGFRLADDVPDERIARELPDLVLDSGRRLLGIAVAVVGELLRPEVLHDRVLHVLDDLCPIVLVGVHAIDAEQRRVRIFEEGEKRIGENVFHACAPGVLPDLLEGRHKAGDDQVALVVADVLHDVERDRVLQVEGGEVHDILDAVLGDIVEKPLDRPAVRVDEGESLAVAQVLYRHILEQGRLAHTRFADDIHVTVTVL